MSTDEICTALCVTVYFRTRNSSPLPTFIYHPFALKASESHLLSRGSFVALWAWVMPLVSSVRSCWCLNDKEGRPWGSKCLSCVFKLPQMSSQWMQLKLPWKYNRKRVIFLRIALYYILLWADNLFKEWQIVSSVWGTSLQPRFSCSCHRFPLLSICSVSKHKMSNQTAAQRFCLMFEWPGWEALKSCCLHLIHRSS